MGAVIYQIYPRSFCDASGDGVGDLEGIRRHLDHLTWLGVDGLWLSPIFPSPMADFGYDVADYCDVDPLFGDLAQLDRLVHEAHERGLRVLLDWVPNHTSDAHPWFVASRSSRDDPKRDWYFWVDGTPDQPPTPWRAHFPPGPAWTWDEPTQAWYYHRYTPQQPDLNWASPAVEAAMHDTLRFWLDRGIDGFRMDVIHGIGKDMSRRESGGDDPVDHARTHELLRPIRKLIDGYGGDRVAVGEVYVLDIDEVATFVGRDRGELHLAFDFTPLFLPWTASAWRAHLVRSAAALAPRDAWPTWVLSSHDIPRVRTRLQSEDAARAAALLLLGLRGTPFLYAGEELGLEDAVVPPDRVVDPAGFRDGCRAPIPWDGTPSHGWAGADPWLPWPPQADERHVDALLQQPGSMPHLYRRLLAARRASPALRIGDQRLLPADPTEAVVLGDGVDVAAAVKLDDTVAAAADQPVDVLAWERQAGDDRRIVAVNFAAEPRPFTPGHGPWSIEIDSTGAADGQPYPGELAPRQALWLRP